MKESFILENIVVGSMETNCYIFGSLKTKEVLVIDPGDEYPKIKKILDANKLQARLIVNTHGHIDHIGADDKFNLPVYIHSLDKDCLLDPAKNLSAMFHLGKTMHLTVNALNDKDKIGFDTLSLEVIHTPGHTPGSVCLKIADIIFTGDTLFCQGIGRTDFPGSSQKQIIQSIKNRLFNFDDEVKIYPGHGPSSTIGNEKLNNPFI